MTALDCSRCYGAGWVCFDGGIVEIILMQCRICRNLAECRKRNDSLHDARENLRRIVNETHSYGHAAAVLATETE